MQIEILQLLQGAKQARGLTVIIDVFRAFSVECYAFAGSTREIWAVDDIDLAYAMGREMPGALLLGERGGSKCAGFACGNSPSQLLQIELAGKTLVHTTSAGTQGISNALQADEILTGSLVNARAVAHYILNRRPERVSLVCMGLGGREPTEEDTLCAEYIRALLLGETPDISAQAAALSQTSGKKFFDPAQQDAFPQADFALCTRIDCFSFVIRAQREGGAWRMQRIDI